ncbi:hypothetical protein HK105_208783 [Polyrhizophydium stewartii]|uniref:Tripartite tricarboxylate transporter TctB family protein n=1 Tax=Polyrhizophydium stewartii TaxID=2732419 RepID=A0ABR4MWT5_9FUNG
MKHTETIKRTALHEWIRWQAITAAVFLLNGGIYSFIFPYETTNIIKMKMPALFNPLPIPGIVAIVAAVLILLIEYEVSLFASFNNQLFKSILYLPLGIFTALQLTLVQPGVFLVMIAIELVVDSMSPQPEDKERLPR